MSKAEELRRCCEPLAPRDGAKGRAQQYAASPTSRRQR